MSTHIDMAPNFAGTLLGITNGFSNIMTDRNMGTDGRMKMEKCLTQNFLLKYGMDVFGKRDLLFIDMRGN